MTLAETTPTEQRAYPVVLTPGDPHDTRRLAEALSEVTHSNALDERFCARVLAALDADDTVDACIYCGCPTADTSGNVGEARLITLIATRDRALTELRAELQHVEGLVDAEATATRYNTVIGRLHAELDQLRGTVARQGDELAGLKHQRDRWLARTVRAEDDLAAATRVPVSPPADPPAEPVTSPPPAPLPVTVSLMSRCDVCARTLAGHIFTDHPFQLAPKEADRA